MPSEAEETAALIDDICSTVLQGSPRRQALLRYLFTHRSEYRSYKNIADDLSSDDAAVRNLIKNLKGDLNTYTGSESQKNHNWRCTLPAAEGDGYQLVFDPIGRDDFSIRFWLPHLSHPRALLLYDDVLLFLNNHNHSITRYFDVNPIGTTTQEILGALRSQRPDDYQPHLLPCYLYCSAAEVDARDMLIRWFNDVAAIRLRPQLNRLISADELNKSSPILLGTPRTNRILKKYYESRTTAHLCYRFMETPLDALEVREIKREEATRLKRIGYKRLSRNIYQGPGDPLGEHIVTGLVTRFPHPSGDGAITTIQSEYSQAIRQISSLLTDAAKLAELLGPRFSERDFPRSFEILFSVSLIPSELYRDNAASVPELISIRTY